MGILFARRSKPLGPLPYRWATFEAAVNIRYAAVYVLAGLIFLWSEPWKLAVFMLFMVPLILISIGLLRRKRYGVVCFFLYPILVTASSIVYGLISAFQEGLTASAGTYASVAGMLLFLVSHFIYYKKRWPLMESLHERSTIFFHLCR